MLKRTQGRLEKKVATIFGAAGAVGKGVAQAFAQEGASVYLSGLDKKVIEEVVESITRTGGTAYADAVDALDEKAVTDYLAAVRGKAGKIDIALNAIGPPPKEYGQGTPTLELPVDKFMLAMETIVRSQFITSRAAAKHMVAQRSGVILILSATPSRGVAPHAAAITTAFGALESLLRSLAVDLSPAGVRVVGIRSLGMEDTRTIEQTFELIGSTMGVGKEGLRDFVKGRTLLGMLPVVVDTAHIAVFLASDEARSLTGAIINSSAGQVID